VRLASGRANAKQDFSPLFRAGIFSVGGGVEVSEFLFFFLPAFFQGFERLFFRWGFCVADNFADDGAIMHSAEAILHIFELLENDGKLIAPG
jgi:hypothetical protein